MKRRLLAALLFSVVVGTTSVAASPSAAQDITQDAAAVVQSLGDQAVAIVRDSSLTPGDREKRFQKMFVENFDVPTIGRFVLGRYWRTATEAQRSEFLTLFEAIIVKTYNRRFADYQGEQFSVVARRRDGDDSAIITTKMTRPSGVETVNVDWRAIRHDDKLKIVDVIIEGISMSVTQQQEFGSVVQRNGGQVEALLQTMRELVQRQKQAAR
jgi:phospholipid transport system substrate-binding protein